MSRIPVGWLLGLAGAAGLSCVAACGSSGGSGSSDGGTATGLFSATGTVTLKRCSLSTHYRCIAEPGLAFGHDVLRLKYSTASSGA